MKTRILLALSAALLACNPAPDNTGVTAGMEASDNEGTASFRIGNSEIRGDMIRMLDAAGIEYSLDDDDAIVYNLSDGEIIDRIGNEAISEYITRN